jgi:hypothetical protein
LLTTSSSAGPWNIRSHPPDRAPSRTFPTLSKASPFGSFKEENISRLYKATHQYTVHDQRVIGSATGLIESWEEYHDRGFCEDDVIEGELR